MTDETVQTSIEDIFDQGRMGERELQERADREAVPDAKGDAADAADKGDEPAADAKAEKPDVKADKAAKPDTTEADGRLAALQSERAKRQELERELQTLRAQPQQPAKQAEPEKVPDLYEDQKGYADWLQKQTDKRLAEGETKLAERWRTMCENAARARHTDYDEAAGHFARMAQANPMLARAMDAQPDPAEFAYKTGRAAMKLQAAGGDLDVFEQQIREDERKKIAGNGGIKAAPGDDEDKPDEDARTQVPTSLNDRKAAAGSGKSEAPRGAPTPLENIIGKGLR